MKINYQHVENTIRCIIATGSKKSDDILTKGCVHYYIFYTPCDGKEHEHKLCRLCNTVEDLVEAYRKMGQDSRFVIHSVDANVRINNETFGHCIADKYITYILKFDRI